MDASSSSMMLPSVYQLGYRAGQSIQALGRLLAAMQQALINDFSRVSFTASTDVTPEAAAASASASAGGVEITSFLESMFYSIRSLPLMYKDWWWNLLRSDPLHVLVETTLLLSIIYMLASRKTSGYKDHREKLSKSEQEELLREWHDHGRAPLAPPGDAAEKSTGNDGVVVHKYDGRYMEVSHRSKPQKTFKVLNFATFDFLGMQGPRNKDVDKGSLKHIKDAAVEALTRYGCGSCGPRGFYGTIDIHLKLEDVISDFTGTENAIMYSDGASTCTSTVAAFAKRGDLLVVDEGVYEPLITGVKLSRANIKWFKHNDMDDLRRVLEEARANDIRLQRKPNAQRRFIVVEGLYKNLGTICPLDQIVALKHEFGCRLILDESFSFGTLGPNGKGVVELYKQRPMYDVEIITIALENSLGSIGGVTVGNEEVVDHQRLSGAGYCFSASAPPFVASAAIQSLKTMESTPSLVQKLQSNQGYMYETLRSKLTTISSDVTAVIGQLIISSDEKSSIIVLQMEKEVDGEGDLLADIANECLQRGVAVVATGQDSSIGHFRTELAPALRIIVSSVHEMEDLDKAIAILVDASKVVMTRFAKARL